VVCLSVGLSVTILIRAKMAEPINPSLRSAHWLANSLKLAARGLFVLSLTVEALQGKMCQNSLPSGEGRSLGAKISGRRGRPCGIFFRFYKTRHILLSDSVNCTVLRAVVLTQYRRVTDRQTDRLTELP